LSLLYFSLFWPANNEPARYILKCLIVPKTQQYDRCSKLWQEVRSVSYIIEVFYRQPRDPEREIRLAEQVAIFGGQFDFWEESTIPEVSSSICITFEFTDERQAAQAVTMIRGTGYLLKDLGLTPHY
jgi:hypothetical protein